MSYSDNVYYHPEKCGVELVAVLEDDEAYEFTMVIAIKAGRDIYLGYDSGCSCPTPFEDVRSLDDLTLVRSRGEVEDFVKGRQAEMYSERWSTGDVIDFVRKVEVAL